MLKQCLLLFLLTVITCAAGLLICPKCGYECASDARFCAHCGATLDAPPAEKMSLTDVPDEPEPFPEQVEQPHSSAAAPFEDLLEQALQQDRAEMKEAMGDDHYGQIWLHAQNAKALAVLLSSSTRPYEVLDTRVLSELFQQQFRCPLCQGSGMLVQPVVLSDGRLQEQQVPGKACAMCEGRGWLRGHRSEESFMRHRTQAMRTFQERMRRWGREPYAGIWLPAGVRTDLSLQQQVAILHITGSTCSSCLGLGRFGCSECKGNGRVACPDGGCVMGRRVCPTCNGTRKENSDASGKSIQRRCHTCMGLGIVDCDTCQGKGWVQCDDCDGRGTELCKACQGLGHKPLCRHCDGVGLIPCRRCNGSGTYKGSPCQTCAGEGQILCKSCRGSGADR